MAVLVTGAAGFIGFNVVRDLLRAGTSEVIGVDSLNEYYDPELKKYRLNQLSHISGEKSFNFYKGSICDRPFLEEVFAKHKIDKIVNLAAMAGVRYSQEVPQVYFETNVLGTLNLLELMRKHSISKFILASTSSLYAGHPTPFSEDQPVNNPISPYAASKKGAEILCYSYHHLYKIDVTVLRFFTVYGPAGRPDMSYFRFIKAIDSGEQLTLFGDGTQSRDFTYISDISKGVLSAMQRIHGFDVINLGGGGDPITINKMIELLEIDIGKKAKISRLPSQSSDMETTRANNMKAKELLGWEPSVNLEVGLKECVSWYIDNRDFVLKLAHCKGN
ncbi:MAG: GDP-mannose 4,6-dehydratase [Bdellovibrionales bacterium]|nr:GDP-mannose 4,6-dehydratase [Bdellovibrionales bacterium]